MWAMIAVSIALIVWCTGLVVYTVRKEKRRLSLAAQEDDVVQTKSIDMNEKAITQ